ncbi:NRT1 ribosyltransferase, partial [Xiphorhynchus elegans]|nr:NRT1 ribosyltransferase [Xiphorhynchus elegans]
PLPTMELLPLLLVLLPGAVATGIEEVALDMAPNSFDDQYLNCRDEMVKELPMLNCSEMATNQIYAQVWAKAAAMWHPPLGPLQRREEATALLAYTHAHLSSEFQKAVLVAGRSHQDYRYRFHFKVLHFLLTEALRDLRTAQSPPGCLHVYLGTREIQFTVKPGQIIRFGYFASFFLKKDKAKVFGIDTLFEVYTCHGAAIRDFSINPEEELVLIPPFESFKVTSVTPQSDTTYIRLSSHGVYSKYNCAWLRGDIPGVGTGGS